MTSPKVTKAVFEPGTDSEINSLFIHAIFLIFGIKWSWKKQRFSGKPKWKAWGAAVEDQHDENEKEPHYYLELGEGDFKSLKKRTYCVAYCDYHSYGKKKKVKEGKTTKTVTEAKLDLAPGKWKIHVWIPDKAKVAKKIAQRVSDAYSKAMDKTLPDYFIPNSGKVKSIKKIR